METNNQKGWIILKNRNMSPGKKKNIYKVVIHGDVKNIKFISPKNSL